MKDKIQVFVIRGGSTFKNQKDYLSFLKNRRISIEEKIRWTDEFLKKSLGVNFKIIKPQMPLKDNAKYRDWKIYFERFFPYLKNNIILIGNSLGGIFLAKYLSENKFPKKILSTYLVCPPYDNSTPGEDLAGGFKLKKDLTLLEKNSKNLYLMFSEDDPLVPLTHAKKYKKSLKNAKFIIYKSKNGHFNIPKFPEIIKMIKKDTKNTVSD